MLIGNAVAMEHFREGNINWPPRSPDLTPIKSRHQQSRRSVWIRFTALGFEQFFDGTTGFKAIN